MKERISRCKGFEWDEWNSNKNWHLHRATDAECEEIFFNQPLIITVDAKHSGGEARYYALGRTEGDRRLFIAFTIRDDSIRVISARDMTRSEKKKYAEKIKRNTDFSE